VSETEPAPVAEIVRPSTSTPWADTPAAAPPPLPTMVIDPAPLRTRPWRYNPKLPPLIAAPSPRRVIAPPPLETVPVV